MRTIGTVIVTSAALLTSVITVAAAPGDATSVIAPHAFANGIDTSGIDMQTGRSAAVDGISNKYRFSVGFTSPCDTARIEELFCRDEN